MDLPEAMRYIADIMCSPVVEEEDAVHQWCPHCATHVPGQRRALCSGSESWTCWACGAHILKLRKPAERIVITFRI